MGADSIGEGSAMTSVPSSSLLASPSTRNCVVVALIGLFALCGCGGNVGFSPTGSGPSTPATAAPSGPQLGYAWKADDQTLRPFLGVPGSSQIGESVVPAGVYIAGSASAASAIGILIGSDQQVYRMTLPSGTPVQLGATSSTGTRIRFSPSGTAALIFVPGSSKATEVTGLVSTPQVRQILVPTSLVDAVLSDAGSIVTLLQGSGGGAVDLLTATGDLEPLATLGGAGGVAFVGTADDVLAADSTANSLTLIRSVSKSPSAVAVPTSNLLKTPAAVGAALNGRWAIVANAGESSVVRVDLTGATTPQRLASASQPVMAEQLYGNGVFRFNEIAAGPVWISDITASSPSMLFIPALPVSTSATGAHHAVLR
jgi:hypothetical protein